MFMNPEVTQLLFRAGLLTAAVLVAVLLAHLPRADRQRVLNWSIAFGVLTLTGLWLAWPMGLVQEVTVNQLVWDGIDFGLFLLLAAVCTRILLGMQGPMGSLMAPGDEPGAE
jgi:hypothetical protein